MSVAQTLASRREDPVMDREEEADGRLRVLVVEDEDDLRELLRYNLDRNGYRVIGLSSGEQAMKWLRTKQPDLILLDLMLPGMDGLEVCRAIKRDRETATIPIVMLTAKDEEADIVAGLELGADDYVTKPFSPRILLARLKAVQRRQPSSQEEFTGDAQAPTIRVGDLKIQLDRYEVQVGDRTVDLTATEFRLLTLLARHPGRVYTRQRIVESIHGQLVAVTDRSVDVLVMGVRRKLGSYGSHVQTVRGVGYRLKG